MRTGDYPKEPRFCVSCGALVPRDRNSRGGLYCQKSCEAAVHGWHHHTVSQREKDQIRAGVSGSTAFRPSHLDPVTSLHSLRPVTIFSDVHTPIHSASWVEHGLLCAKSVGSDILIINGDFIDANQISKHAGSYFRRGASLENDFQAAESLLGIFSKQFKEVHLLMGNHDMRVIHRFGGEVSVQRAMMMLGAFPNLKVTSRSFIDVNEYVRIVHPRQYSRIRGALAQKLCQRWQKSILTGHQHHSAMTLSSDGKYQACDVGCMADVDSQDYIRNEITDNVEPVNGFAMVVGNYIQVFDRHTKWGLFGLPEPMAPGNVKSLPKAPLTIVER